MTTQEDRWRTLAEAIADDLFTAGDISPAKADHLELTTGTRGTSDHRYLGGWAKGPVVDRIQRALAQQAGGEEPSELRGELERAIASWVSSQCRRCGSVMCIHCSREDDVMVLDAVMPVISRHIRHATGAAGEVEERAPIGSYAFHLENLLRMVLRAEDWDEVKYIKPKIEHRLAAEAEVA